MTESQTIAKKLSESQVAVLDELVKGPADQNDFDQRPVKALFTKELVAPAKKGKIKITALGKKVYKKLN